MSRTLGSISPAGHGQLVKMLITLDSIFGSIFAPMYFKIVQLLIFKEETRLRRVSFRPVRSLVKMLITLVSRGMF